MTVLTAHNVDRVEAVARTALAAGADRIGVIPVHDFGQGEPAAAADRVVRGLDTLRRLRAEGVLDNSLAYLDRCRARCGARRRRCGCYAPYASVVVDCYGDVFPCFPFMERKQPLGRLPLARLWRSPAYQRERERLEACQACLWNCHTEMNLVLPQARASRALAGASP